MITLERKSLTIGFVGGLLVMLAIWMTSANVLGDEASPAFDQPELAPTTIAPPDSELRSADPPDAADPAPEQDAGAAQAAVQHSALPSIAPAELPPEAFDTLDLIASNGPFPFRQDDGIFQNREGFLPDEPRGHYREYTVVTPGEGDRGARRIVAGANGELYYTSDHYASFREIVAGTGGSG